jgi:hypothetical protein
MADPKTHEVAGKEATWSVTEALDWMVQHEQAEKGLKEVGSSIFRQQLSHCLLHGYEWYWGHIEMGWKDKTDDSPIPSKYRSSKCVIIKALDYYEAGRIELLEQDKDGKLTDKLKGKTALENAYKEWDKANNPDTEAATNTKTLEDYIKAFDGVATGVLKNLSGDDQRAFVEYVASWGRIN